MTRVAENRNHRSSIFSGNIDINIFLSFIFGVVFISVMLIFATYFPNPTPFQIKSFVTVLALAAAGVGAVIPGFIEVKYKTFIRASGALALFVIVFFFQPTIEQAVVHFDVPKSPPEPVAVKFLEYFDNGNIAAAWEDLDIVAKGVVVPDKKAIEQVYASYRKPLGKVISREITGVGGQESPPGYPIGLYRVISYRTRFEKSDGCRAETVALRATQSISWKVYNYQIFPIKIEC